MSKKKISVIISVKNYLLSSFIQYFPQCRNVKQNKSHHLQNRKVFLSPEISNFTNHIHKRNCSSNNNYNRHGYDEKLEVLMNEQINAEFSAGYEYLNIASYYGRSNVALPGCYGFFMKMYYEEQDHAIGFLKYQNLRGGLVRLTAISTVTEPEWPDVTKSFACALVMEKNVKQKLVNIYKVAEQLGDTDVMNMLDMYIEQQEQSICELSRLLTRANELTKCDVGKYLFDRELHETHVKGDPAKCTTETASKLYT